MFIWNVEVHGNWYGTRADVVAASLHPRFNRLALIVHKAVETLHFHAQWHGMEKYLRHIYILPPKDEILRERLLRRGESADKVEKRIRDCHGWDEEARRSNIPYYFLQDKNDLDEKIRKVREHFLRV